MRKLIDKEEAIKALEAIGVNEPNEIRVIGSWVELNTESCPICVNLNNVMAAFKNTNKKDKWRTGLYVKYPADMAVSSLHIQVQEEYEDVLEAIRRAQA